MAMPYIMSGIRIAAVSSVGTMTIAAFAGANGLGSFIQLGMNSLNYPMTIMGAVAAALMALTLDFLLGRVERAFTNEGLLPQDQIKKPEPVGPVPPEGDGRRAVPSPAGGFCGILRLYHRMRSSGEADSISQPYQHPILKRSLFV